jgi:hypothetical protein
MSYPDPPIPAKDVLFYGELADVSAIDLDL